MTTKTTDQFQLVRNFAKLVMGVAFVAMLLWALGFSTQTDTILGLPGMKFPTALSFLFSGFMLYTMAKTNPNQDRVPGLLILSATLFIAVIMVPLFLTYIYHHSFEWESILLTPSANPLNASSSLPSIGTTGGFVLIAFAGIASSLKSKHQTSAMLIISSGILLLGARSLIGRAINAPLLYFSIPNVSQGMPIVTSLLFLLIGLGMFMVWRARGD